MASSSPTDTEDNLLTNLEVEAHYLTQALSKLSRNSPEWSYLNEKLSIAEEQLEAATAMRMSTQQWDRGDDYSDGDDGNEADTNNTTTNYNVHGPYYDIPDDTDDHNNQQQPPSPYRDDMVEDYWGGNAGDDDRSSSRHSDHPSGRYSDNPNGRYSDNPNNNDDHEQYYDGDGNSSQDDGNPLFDSSPSYEHSNRNSGRLSNMNTRGRFTSGSRKILAWTLLSVIMLILSTLLLTVSRGVSNNASNSNQSDGNNIDVSPSSENNIVGPQIDGPCASFSMHLIPDQFGNETSWKIVRFDDGASVGRPPILDEEPHTVVLSGGPYSYKKGFDDEGKSSSHYEMAHATTCLPVGSYAFVLFDAKGDGICCDYGRGEYGINLSKGRVIRPLTNGNFKAKQELTLFEVASDDIDVLPDISTHSNANSNPSDPSQLPAGGPTHPCASFSMHLIPDQFGNETSWKIQRYDGVGQASNVRDSLIIDKQQYQEGNGITVLSGGPYLYKKQFDHDAIGGHYEMIHATTCLPVGSYTFTLLDAKGDGICCNYGRGEYGINLSKGRVIRPLSLGKFEGAGQVTPFQVSTDDIDILPELLAAADVDENNDPSDDFTSPASSSLLDGSADDFDESCASFTMHLVPDQFGNETSWKVLKYNGGGNIQEECSEFDQPDDGTYQPTYYPTASPEQNYNIRYLRDMPTSGRLQRRAESGESPPACSIVLEGGPYSYRNEQDSETAGSHYNAIIAQACLPIGSYAFLLFDSDWDGICCDHGRGEYGINLSRRVIRPLSLGKFKGASEFTLFEVKEDDIDVIVPLATSDSVDETSVDDTPQATASDIDMNNVDQSSLVPDNTVNDGDPDTSSFIVGSQPSETHHPMTSVNSLTNSHLLSSLVTVSGDDSTTNHGKSYGILFDVKTPDNGGSSIIISGMDLYLDTTSQTHYEIWTKKGSWQDVNESNPDYFAGFSQISKGQITGKGAADFTKIELRDFQDVKVQGGGYRQAFYLTLSDNRLVFKSNVGEGMSRHEMAEADVVQETSPLFELYYGAAVRAYPLERAVPATDFWYNAGFLGRMWYKEK